ncbi:MAG: peptide-methionine (S)-S-oxide reductase MsrA [Gammaproteobacteria bacterium]|nr:peptide-methionine (S)-S-oxide reductase MsrA [Gammaproteobacteria bacterium]
MSRCVSFITAALLAATVTSSVFAASDDELATATFAGGCFWCVESDFDTVPGVVETISGYTGGTAADPTYKQVTAGGTGHREAVQIRYDPKQVSYERLLHIFWRSVDPTDGGGQFCDRGESYQTAIFVGNEEERRLAETSKEALERSMVLDAPVVTPIEAAGEFYPAEDYHQDYYEKNPFRYRYYRFACRRDSKVQQVWGKQAHDGIGSKLTHDGIERN